MRNSNSPSERQLSRVLVRSKKQEILGFCGTINRDSPLTSHFRLFNDGYVESLLTAQLKQEGVHVYVGKGKPFMKLKTDEGKEYYDLWFILKGRGANRGSVLQARCKCNGGRDGGCKHIAAAMYTLEDLLNTRGEDTVTSGPCVSVRTPRANTQACEVKDLVIEKGKKTFP